jgi:RNA polymerase sigma-70 factor (ECF subfamily)
MTMDRSPSDRHLSQLSTAWTTFFRAHEGLPDEAAEAKRRLLQRYGGPIYRYLLGALRDEDAADELYQEFALRLVRGDFRRATPDRGRLRDFLKTSLYHLVVDAQRRRQRDRALPLAPDTPEPAAGATTPGDADREFAEAWHADLLRRTWDALAEWERRSGQPLHTVLRLRADLPDLRSADLAERLAVTLGKPVTAGWVRKRIFQARAMFSDILVEEVAQSLAPDSVEALEDELSDLGLLDICREALARRRGRG